MGATLLGKGYDDALTWLSKLLNLEVIEIPSGTKLETWTVPDEWIVRDAWVKFKGKKIIDYKTQPLSLIVYSEPFKGTVSKEELLKHLIYSDDNPKSTPYNFKFYERTWGFCVPKTQIQKQTDPIKNTWVDTLKDGEYEVFIDTEFKPGVMKLGVHTIPGKSDREILMFAHLDHPYQANDNLSGVACLADLAPQLKCDHTIKIVFCPETIGSIGYALTQDLSKVDFVIAVDICGNTNDLLFQKSFDEESKINRVMHLALQNVGESYRKGIFRSQIGSDEYIFNDPKIGIPGIMLSRWPYKEYHTADDTPEKIDYDAIKRVQKVILKAIDIWEKDKVPERLFTGPLMRSKYNIQTPFPLLNLSHDYLFFRMDGKKSVAELCTELALNFDYTMEFLEKMNQDGIIRWVDTSESR